MADRDKLAEAKERFRLSQDAESENRQCALDDMRFARLGEQWPESVLRDREREGRPCLTINRLPAFARQIINDARQNKPAIKVKPADSGADVDTANVYNGLIRSIEVNSNAEVAYDTALECAVYGGFGYFRIKTDYAHDDTFDLDLCIERVSNPFTVYSDPASQAADASDWRYGFITEMMPIEDFRAQYGKNATISDWDSTGDGDDDSWRTEDMVRVAEYWHRTEVMRPIVQLSTGLVIEAALYQKHRDVWDAQGVTVIGERETRSYVVTQCVMTGAEILSENEWAGRYIPIIPVYGDEVNIEGRRYFRSMVRDVADAQRNFNYWRTAATELVALAPKAPFIGPKGAFDSDFGRWQTANAKSHPFLEYDGPVAPQRQPFAGIPAGAVQEALNASDDMKSILGIYDASLGARSNETSGRAIMARQREGDVSTFHFIDNLSRGIRYCGRVLIDMIPHVYSGQRIVRVLGEDGVPKNVPINAPDERGHVYDLARGKYDLVVDTGPSYSTKREETNAFLTEVMRANPATAPLLMDVVARNMDFPESEKVAARFRAMLPPPIQALEQQDESGGAPQAEVLMQQLVQARTQMQQMQQALQQVEVQRTQLEAQKLQQDGALEQAKMALEKQLADQETALKKYQTDLDAQVKLQIETMRAQEAAMAADRQMAQTHADARAKAIGVKGDVNGELRSEDDPEPHIPSAAESLYAAIQSLSQQQQATAQALAAVVAGVNAPKRVVRDPMTNRVIGVEPVQQEQPQ